MDVNSNKIKIIDNLIKAMCDSIEKCDDEVEKTRLNVCVKGLQMYFMEDEVVAKRYLMFNKDIAEEDISEFVEKNKKEIERIRNDRIRESLYWVANNWDVIG